MGSTTSPPPEGDGSRARSGWLASLGARLAPHRQRLSRLLVVALVLAVAMEIAPNVPRGADLEFALGPNHSDIVRVRLGYVQDGEVFHSVRFDYPMGAPTAVVHRLSLPTGDYRVDAELEHRDGRVSRVSRSLTSPVEGRLRLLLGSGESGERRP